VDQYVHFRIRLHDGQQKFYGFTFMAVEVVAFVASHLQGFTFKDL
jgi:hypothetical protein